jgi:hypothetical protein
VYIEPLAGVPLERPGINGVECIRGVKRSCVRGVECRGIKPSRLVERGPLVERSRITVISGDIELSRCIGNCAHQPGRDLADLSSRRGPHRQRRHHSRRDGVEGQREGEARRRYLRQPTCSA